MPVYAYKGVNQAGRSTKGTISAESPRAARAQMRSAGVFLTEIAESAGGGDYAALIAAPTRAGRGSRSEPGWGPARSTLTKPAFTSARRLPRA